MSTIRIPLAYGHTELYLDVPETNLHGVYCPQAIHETIDEDRLIRDALTNPTGTPPLRQLVRPGQKIAIVTSDLTRPTPTDRLLPYIANELQAAGVLDRDVIIVLGLGLHRLMTAAEMDSAVSAPLRKRYRVVNHDPDDIVYLGVTSRGTPVEFFRPLVEADVRMCLGNIEYHYFAGYSGGAKAILPGCASKATVTANHSWMVEQESTAGRIDDNPVRQDLEEGVSMLGVDFILNVVVDGEHKIIGAFAGDVTAAHRRGCALVDQRGRVELPHLCDVVVAGAGGYPKDINLYQAHKALENAKYFLRAGGVLILVAECEEGFGNQTFRTWMLEIASPDRVIKRIRQQFVLGGHKAAAIALIEKQASIYLVSSLPDKTVRRCRFTPFPGVQIALDRALGQLGAASAVLVLPQAQSILPIVSSSDYQSTL